MTEIIYQFCRDHEKTGGAEVMVVEEGKKRVPLPPRNDVANHSPDGFQWGYGGSGPAQLALALCIHATGDVRRAQRVYQDFKFRVLAPMKDDLFTITRTQVLEHIEAVERARNRSGNPHES